MAFSFNFGRVIDFGGLSNAVDGHCRALGDFDCARFKFGAVVFPVPAVGDARRRTVALVKSVRAVVHGCEVHAARMVIKTRPFGIPAKSHQGVGIAAREEAEHVKVMHRAFEEEAKFHGVPPVFAPRAKFSVVAGIASGDVLEATQATVLADPHEFPLVAGIAIILNDGAGQARFLCGANHVFGRVDGVRNGFFGNDRHPGFQRGYGRWRVKLRRRCHATKVGFDRG